MRTNDISILKVKRDMWNRNNRKYCYYIDLFNTAILERAARLSNRGSLEIFNKMYGVKYTIDKITYVKNLSTEKIVNHKALVGLYEKIKTEMKLYYDEFRFDEADEIYTACIKVIKLLNELK